MEKQWHLNSEKGGTMPYIPKEHEKYNLLPLCREYGGEVFEYPSNLLCKLEKFIKPDDQLDPYGFKSYQEYDSEIDRVAQRFADQPDVMALFAEYKSQIRAMNCKEQWSVLRYIGPADDRLFSVTPGKNYYWPSQEAKPVYSGVIDDEEYTAYLYPTDSDLWEILEDPTGMAYNTIYGNGKNKLSKAAHDHIMKQLENAVIEE